MKDINQQERGEEAVSPDRLELQMGAAGTLMLSADTCKA
jgi:hypothetical protein